MKKIVVLTLALFLGGSSLIFSAGEQREEGTSSGPATALQSAAAAVVVFDTVGFTSWDAQHDNSMRRQIAKDDDGFLHFAWTYSSDDTAYRNIYYNARYSDGFWLEPEIGVSIPGSQGPITGFPALDLLPDNREVVAYQRLSWLTTISIEHAVPGMGQFNSFDIPDSCANSMRRALWPSIATAKTWNGYPPFIHVIMTQDPDVGSQRNLQYARCFEKRSNQDTLVCESPGWGTQVLIPVFTKLAPNKIPFQFGTSRLRSAIVITSPVSQKTAIVWLQSTGADSTQNELAYLVSNNNGADWMAAGSMGTLVQVTNYSSGGYADRAYPDVAAVYDYNDDLHLIWTTYKSTDQNDVTLWHWSSATGINEISFATAPSSVHPGDWNLLIAKPTVAVESNPGDPAYNYLYCVYTKFKDGDISAGGYANGDLYLQGSSNGGLTWGPATNLTNTNRNGCTAGNCLSEHWASMAELADDSLYIEYICDKDAGAFNRGEGALTYNPVRYIMYLRPLVSAAPIMEFSPTDMTDPVRSALIGGSTQDSIEFDNIGTATLYVQLNGPSWLSASPNTFSIVEGGPTQKIDLTLDAGAFPETLLVDSLRIISNHERVGGGLVYSDTQWVRIHFAVQAPPFIRGDANGDGNVTITDVVYTINYLFKSGPPPDPVSAADANCDGKQTVADVVFLINYLFKSGPKPAC